MICIEDFDVLKKGIDYEVLHQIGGAIHIKFDAESDGWFSIKHFKGEENGTEKNSNEGWISSDSGNNNSVDNSQVCSTSAS